MVLVPSLELEILGQIKNKQTLVTDRFNTAHLHHSERVKLNPPKKMERGGPDEQRYLRPYKIVKLLMQSETRKEELASQVKELNGQLQSANTHCADQEEKVKELTAKLEEQSKETESLRHQMEEIVLALMSSRRECDTLQQRMKHFNGIIIQEAAVRQHNQSMKNELYHQLSRVTKQLDEERSLKNKFIAAERKAQKEVERLQELSTVKPGQDELEKQIKELVKEVEELKAECKVGKEKNAELLRELEEIKVHEQSLLADLDLVSKLKTIRHQLEHMLGQTQILQRVASELKLSFTTELGDLKSQIKTTASTNPALAVKIEVEDKDIQDFGQETTKLKVDVLKQENASVPNSQVSDFLEEVSVPEENLPTSKKKRTKWERLFCYMEPRKKKKNRDLQPTNSNVKC